MKKNKTQRKLVLKKAIEKKHEHLRGILRDHPNGFQTCCGVVQDLEGLWRWVLGCGDFTAELEEELFGTDDGSNIERTNEEFDAMFEALAPDLGLPVAALEI